MTDTNHEKSVTAPQKSKIELMKLPYGIQKSIIYSLSVPALERLSQTNSYFEALIRKSGFRGRVSSIAFWHYHYFSNSSASYSDTYSLLVNYFEFADSKTIFFKNELPENLFNIVTDRLRLAGGDAKVEKELLKRLKLYNLKTNGLCTELLLQSIPEAVSIVDCSYLRLTEGEEHHITMSLIENIQQYNLLGFRTDIPMVQSAFFNVMLKWKLGLLKMPVISYILVIGEQWLMKSMAKLMITKCKSCIEEFDRCFEFSSCEGRRGVLMLQKDNGKHGIRTVLFGVGADVNIEKQYKNCIYYTKLT